MHRLFSGYIRAIAILLALGVGTAILGVTSPPGLYLCAAGTVYWLSGKRQQPWAKGIRSASIPFLTAFTVLTFILLVMNFAGPDAGPEKLADVERSMIWLDTTLPHWLKISPKLFILLLVILIGSSFLIPKIRLISHVISARKYTSRTLATLTCATAFTFFGNQDIVQDRAHAAHQRATAVYRTAIERQHKAVGRYLAVRAITQSLAGSPPGMIAFYGELFHTLAITDYVPAKFKIRVAHEYAGRDAEHLKEAFRIPQPPAPLAVADLGQYPLSPEQARMQFAAIDNAGSRAGQIESSTDEAFKGLKKIVSETLGMADDEAMRIAWSYFDHLSGVYSGVFATALKPYSDKILTAYLDHWVDDMADRTRKLWGERTFWKWRVDPATDLRVGIETLASDVASDSARSATELARTARSEATAGLATEGELSAAQAVAKAEEAKEAAQVLKNLSAAADIGRPAVPLAQVGVEAAAVALASAKAAELAAHSVEAARTAAAAADAAKAATGAVKAAEAAKAAKAANGVIDIIRVIPK
jgi:hypothetical protein